MTTLPVVVAGVPSAAQTDAALLPVYPRFPIEVVRGEGVRLFDADGRSYLDFTSGIGVNALGYADAGIGEPRCAVRSRAACCTRRISFTRHRP